MDDVYRTTDKHNRHDPNGHEVLNPTPMAPPVGYKPSLSLAEQIRMQVRTLQAMDMEPETEEEADDFDIDDDPAPLSRWENDMIPSIKETRKRARELEAEARLYANPTPPAVLATPPQAQDPPPPAPPPEGGGFFRRK